MRVKLVEGRKLLRLYCIILLRCYKYMYNSLGYK